SHGRSGRTCRTKGYGRESYPSWSPATTSASPGTWIRPRTCPSDSGDALQRLDAAELRQPFHQAGRHPLHRAQLDVAPETLLELVAAAAVAAAVEVCLGKRDLRLGQLPVEKPLEELLAFLAVIVAPAHAASSASLDLSWRRPRCSLDITVPIGTSRICA